MILLLPHVVSRLLRWPRASDSLIVRKNFDSGESENPHTASNWITTVARRVQVYDRCHYFVNFGKSPAILPVMKDKTV